MIHGPALDGLGTREPDVYGAQTLQEIDGHIREVAAELSMTVEIHQTARESEFVRLLTGGTRRFDGAVVNPAALSHTSDAIAEAVRNAPYPVIEAHMSNIHAREAWRRRSVTAAGAAGVVAGFKGDSYALALMALRRLIG